MKHLVLDTETTGLSPNYNKTLTVGMLLIDVTSNFLDILDQNHIFIKHDDYHATQKALKINRINLEEHHKIAIEPKTACLQINNFIIKNTLHQTPILGHNISFDRGFLNALFKEEEIIPAIPEESVDTMHYWNSLKRQNLVPPTLRSNLQTLADFFQIDYTKAHDALADCHITAKVYHEMLKL